MLRFLEWRVGGWLLRETDWDDLHPLVAAGLRAHAQRQAALHRALGESFKAKWDTKAVRAARAAKTDQDITDLLYE